LYAIDGSAVGVIAYWCRPSRLAQCLTSGGGATSYFRRGEQGQRWFAVKR